MATAEKLNQTVCELDVSGSMSFEPPGCGGDITDSTYFSSGDADAQIGCNFGNKQQPKTWGVLQWLRTACPLTAGCPSVEPYQHVPVLKASLHSYPNARFIIGIFGHVYSVLFQLLFEDFGVFGGGFGFTADSPMETVFVHAKADLYATCRTGDVGGEMCIDADGGAGDIQTKGAIVRLLAGPVSSKTTAGMTTRPRLWNLDSSAEDHVSTVTPSMASSFVKERKGIIKLIILYIFAVGCLTFAAAAPAESEAVTLLNNEKGELIIIEPEGRDANDAIILGISEYLNHSTPELAHALQKRSAGLAWGPVYIGNLKLSLTNPHVGYAGPKFRQANHVNFHVDKKAPKNSWAEVVNMHIVKYTRPGKICLYAWDSVTKKVVFDSCFDHIRTAIPEAVKAIKKFVDALLKDADFVAAFVIIAALGIALVVALTGLGAVAIA